MTGAQAPPNALERWTTRLRLPFHQRRSDVTHGALDSPVPDLIFDRSEVVVAGWTTHAGRPASAIRILINGKVVLEAPPNVCRPDVARALRLSDLTAPYGWSATVDASRFARARLTISALALLPSGEWWPVGTATIGSLEPPSSYVGATGSLDTPRVGERIDGDVVPVRGWALFGSDLPSRIEVEVDGVRVGAARAQVPRPDVAASIPRPSALASGFEYLLSMAPPAGSTQYLAICVVATHRSGRTWRSDVRHVVVVGPAEGRQTIDAATRGRRSRLRTPGHRRRAPTLVAFTHSLAMGGGQLFLSELLKLMRRDHDLSCAVISLSDGPLSDELKRFGIPVRVTHPPAVRDAATYGMAVRELSALADRTGAPVALVNTLGMFPAADAALGAGMRVIWSIHESFDIAEFAYLNWGPERLPSEVRDRWMSCFRQVAATIFECEATGDLFRSVIPKERRLVIPYGIPVGEVAVAKRHLRRLDIRRRLGVPRTAKVMLSVGVFEPRKGQGTLVEALASITPAHQDLMLALVGAHESDYTRQVRRMVSAHGLEERVLIVPITGDVYPWYRAADVLISASDVESVPRSVLEAMAFGLPVLAAEAFGVGELVADGHTGWTFPPRDFSGLVAAIERWATLDEKGGRRVARTAATMSGAFDSRLYAADYTNLVRALAAGESGAVGSLVSSRGWRGPSAVDLTSAPT